MRTTCFPTIFVSSAYNIGRIDRPMTSARATNLGPNYVLETVREERLQFLKLSRLSRVKEIRDGAAVLTAPDTVKHEVPKERAEIEKLRRAYLENFVKMLP